jgi:hypothetical protein
VQRGVIAHRPDSDDLTVGAMDLGAPDRYPPGERGIKLGDRVETPPGQHMITHDVYLAFHTSFGPRRQLHLIPTIGIAASG